MKTPNQPTDSFTSSCPRRPARPLVLLLLAVACESAPDARVDPTPPVETPPADDAESSDEAPPRNDAQPGVDTPPADDAQPDGVPAEGAQQGDGVPAEQAPPEPMAAAGDAPVDATEPDPVLTFARENGFGGIFFALDCASVSADGDILDGAGLASLPVGGGRRLECRIAVAPRVTQSILDSADEPWCQLGQLTAFRPNALDDRLALQVESTPADEPWFVVATHAGDEITIIRATGVWPLGIEADYDTMDLQRADGRTCEEVFGLSASAG